MQILFVEVCSVVACHGRNLPLSQRFECKHGLIMTILNNNNDDSKSFGHQLNQVPFNWRTRFSCSCIKNLVACNSHLRPMEHLNHMHHISVGLICFYVSIALFGCSRCFLCNGFQFWCLDIHGDAKVTFVIFKSTVNGFRSATRIFCSKISTLYTYDPIIILIIEQVAGTFNWLTKPIMQQLQGEMSYCIYCINGYSLVLCNHLYWVRVMRATRLLHCVYFEGTIGGHVDNHSYDYLQRKALW